MSQPEDEVVLRVLGVLRTRVREDPYRTLAVAAALGLALGARFWGRLATSLLAAGARIAIAAVVPPMIDEAQWEA
jgi:hypothetical protein